MRAYFLELTSQVGKYVHEYSINHSVMPVCGASVENKSGYMEMLAYMKK